LRLWWEEKKRVDRHQVAIPPEDVQDSYPNTRPILYNHHLASNVDLSLQTGQITSWIRT